MIYLLIKEHNQEYSLSNLIKAFFPNEEIKIIYDIKDYLGLDILIESFLRVKQDSLYAITNIYTNNNLLKTQEENIEEIKIPGEVREKKIRIGIRKSLYSAIDYISKLDSPWGILTGIRPMKIVHDLINKGIYEDEIRNILKEHYKLDSKKIDLMMDIVKIQRDYIYPLKDRYSLYISIPFCPSKCFYCSFPSLSIKSHQNQIDKYIENLIYEIECISNIMKNKRINTVYIGGGTPTSISESSLEKIIQAVYANFERRNINEFTVEAGRPDTITKKHLEMLRKNDIQRISINPQTMNDKTLKEIGRKHSVNDIIKTYNMAREIGFECINMDLIIGLPGEGVKEVEKTIEQIKKLDPDNLTVHTLALKTGSNLNQSSMEYSREKQNMLRTMLDKTFQYSNAMELYPYYLYRQKKILGNLENIGFSKLNKECIYNIVMMEEKETIIGAGMGSISKIYFPEEDKIKRIANFKDLKQYINRVDELILKKQYIINNW